MKKENPVRILFGLKQEEMAMLLGISRAHWGMYEIGKRDLPLGTMQLMSEMVIYVHQHENTKKRPKAAEPSHELKAHLKFLLRENQYRRLQFEKKKEEIEKKMAAESGWSLLADFLKTRADKVGKNMSDLHQFMINKIADDPSANDAKILLKYELRLEVLKYEKTLLESRMQKLL